MDDRRHTGRVFRTRCPLRTLVSKWEKGRVMGGGVDVGERREGNQALLGLRGPLKMTLDQTKNEKY